MIQELDIRLPPTVRDLAGVPERFALIEQFLLAARLTRLKGSLAQHLAIASDQPIFAPPAPPRPPRERVAPTQRPEARTFDAGDYYPVHRPKPLRAAC